MVRKDKGSNIEKLAQTIADDINKLDKVAAEIGGLKDLKSVDLAAFLPGSTIEILKGMLNQFKAKAEEASQQNKERVEEISSCIENSIKDRRAKLASGLKALGKTAVKDDAESKTILNHVSARVDLSNRRLNELQIEKTVKPAGLRRTGINNADVGKK